MVSHPNWVSIALAMCLSLALALAAPASAKPKGDDDDTVLVLFQQGTSKADREAAYASAGARDEHGEIEALGVKVVKVKDNHDPAAVAAKLERKDRVVYAETNKLLSVDATPNDPRFGEMYGLHNTGQTGGTSDADIDAPAGWNAPSLAGFPSTGGAKVGIVDTGIQTDHPDLAGKIANCAQSRGLLGLFAGQIQVGQCADDNGHGTHVAGTISANTNNGVGVAGVSFNSPLAICRALGGPLGMGSTADVANCITWLADNGARVISMSLGGGNSTTLRNAVTYAASRDVVQVAAAGNDGDSTVNYPAGYPEVISVAATDHNDARASFSNANADVEVAAPGVDVLSTYTGSSYRELSGTSMATPHAAGVAAVIRTLNPGFSGSSTRTRLQSSSDDKGAPGRDTSFGFGRVNLANAAT